MGRKRTGLTNRQLRELGLKIANSERVEADLLQRRSSAGRPHDSRPRRQRSRRDSDNAAVRDQG
jgi:hypothetical protein